MPQTTPRIRRSLLVPALLVIVGLAFFGPGAVFSGGISQEGHWEYVPTTYAQNSGAQCPQGLDCQELCFVGVNGIQGTKRLCCVDTFGVCHEDLR
ncbi:MAG: hypothetical protein AAGC60_07160 [Acidobacteriota bacterium]